MNRCFLPRPLLFLALLGYSGGALAQSAARLKAIDLVKEAAADFAHGDLPLVIKICQQAISLDPTYPRAQTYLGAAYQKRGDRQSACGAFKKAMQLAPGTPDALRAARGLRELGCNALVRAAPRASTRLPSRTSRPVRVARSARASHSVRAAPRPILLPNLRLEARWNATSGLASLAFSVDGSQISGAGTDGAWRLWRSRDGRLDRLESGHGYAAVATATGPQTAVAYGDGSVRFFDAAAGREVGRLDASPGNISALCYAAGGAFLAAAGRGGELQILQGRSGALLQNIGGGGLLVSGAAFSPDGRLIAAGIGSQVRIYETATARLVRVLAGDGLPVAAVAWSRSGLLAGASGYNIRVWNGASGRLQRVLSGHKLAVAALSFGSDNLLASGGYDGQLRLWNASTGANALFAFHGAPVHALNFDASGTRLVSGDGNGLIGVWRLD